MRNHTPEERYKLTIRVNRDLLEEIRVLAQREHRTINGYLIHQLTKLTAQDRPQPAATQSPKGRKK